MPWTDNTKQPPAWGMTARRSGDFDPNDFDAFDFDTGETAYRFVHPPLPSFGQQQKPLSTFNDLPSPSPAWGVRSRPDTDWS